MNSEALRLLDEMRNAASALLVQPHAWEAYVAAHNQLRAILSAQEDDVCDVPNWAVVKAFVEHSQTPDTTHACYPDRAPVFIEKVMRRASELAKQEAK